MSSALRASHAPRYAELGRLLLKHRGAALDPSQTEFELELQAEGPPGADGPGASAVQAEREDAQQLAAELVGMGPTFIKLGQLLSTRSDLLPPAYLEALSGLRDHVQPFPADEAVQVIEEELGVRVSKAFGSFQRRPIGAASLGQVHRATLRDGREVAIKVQRPGIRRQAVEDMEVIGELAQFIDGHSESASRFGFAAMVDEFRRSLMDELDYRREAANLRLLGEQLADFEHIVVPRPVDDFTSSRVLTMEFVSGKSIASMGPLARMEIDSPGLGEELVGAYLDQVLVHGFFHADPHPGNVLVTDDGRLALIDLGMVARLSPQVQEQLLRLLLAIADRRGEDAADALEHLGTRLEDYDLEQLRDRVSDLVLRYGSMTVADMPAGRLLGEMAMAASRAGLRPRSELTMLAKALLNLDHVARTLDPDIEVDRIVQSHAARVMRHRMLEAASPTAVMRSALEATAFAEALPGRMNKVLESLAEGRLTLNLEGLDENAIMRGAQKVANRMATGLVIAAFVVAAALFSTGRGTATLWGYPLLTMIFLGLALVASGWLALGVFRGDLPQRGGRRS
ncbi:MAG TPA: AarF/UbiB family protein [Acidimicrobiales bacterium]|nr:AarF/UbiB family protein [Acidimicrobiales bacterium]